MSNYYKEFVDLEVSDFKRFPVWERDYDGDPEYVFPVREEFPVSCLSDRFVGTELELANGSAVWAILGLIDLQDAFYTMHFRLVSVAIDSEWFELCRHFDVAYERYNSEALCKRLGLEMDEVYPIKYSLSGVAEGHPEVVEGTIDAFLEEPLSRKDAIAIAVSGIKRWKRERGIE